MTPMAQYQFQRSNAKRRGIAWDFSFDSWLAVWVASGHFAQRGRGRGKYVMARRGDIGPYSPTNVEIVLYETNAVDSRRNHPVETSRAGQRTLGRGRGWTERKPGVFQVTCGKTYIGTFHSQEEAEGAYMAAAAARAKWHAGRLIGLTPTAPDAAGRLPL